MTANNAVILDNGAYTAKLGMATYEEPLIIPNCIMKAKSERRRPFIANQIDECRDASGLFYLLCFQKGYLLNWDVQKSVWDHIFSNEGSGISLDDRSLLITEPQMNFSSIQEATMEILFEDYHCSGVYKTTTAELAAYTYALQNEDDEPVSVMDSYTAQMESLICIVIDVGYSFTHVVPFVLGERVMRGIRRVEVGGKVLTNHLKEVISYRHLNMMDESYVVNQIKEDVCYVSQNFVDDMRVHSSVEKRAEVVVEYVLPDFSSVKRGYIRRKPKSNAKKMKISNETSENIDEADINSEETDVEAEHDNSDQQSLRLCNERFTVPELLFNPSDVGIPQMGIAESVIDALKDCPEIAHCELLRNIIIVGGSSLFPGFVSRLKTELRSLAPDDMEVSIIFPDDPIAHAWYGGKELACSDHFKDLLFTREEYEENGYSANGRR